MLIILYYTVILKETIVNYLRLRTFEVKLLLNKEIPTVRSQYVLYCAKFNSSEDLSFLNGL